LLSAIELDLFTHLAQGPLDAPAIRQRLSLHPRSTTDFLDALVSLGVLERSGAGPTARYANTPDTAFFLDKSKPSYAGGILEMSNARLYPFWGSLTTALKTGQPQNEASRGHAGLFETLYADPQRLRLFLAGMTGISMGAAVAIAQKFPWKNYKTFADVGGAQGAVPVQVALAHKHLKGMNFDLPQVGPIFAEYAKSFGLSDRLSFKPGDFFKDPMPSVDVIVMGHILHDWSLE